MNQNTALVTTEAPAPAPVVTTSASLKAIQANFGLLQEAMESVLRKDVHYGVIPGTGDKPTLLKPGADVICALFHLSPAYQYQITDLGNGHREYLAHCAMADVTGRNLGQGVGLAATLESKYRYRKGGITCPRCGKPTIFKSKQDKGGGWFCWSKKGGCGAEFKAGDKEITGQQVDEKVEYDNPADYYNTCLKMAAKRALVAAVLTITGASAVFTQDLEDMRGDVIDGEIIPPEPEPTEAELLAELIQKAGLTTEEERAHLKRFVSDTAVAQKKDALNIIKASLGHFDSFKGAFQKWLKKQQAPAEPLASPPAAPADPPPAGDGQTTKAAADTPPATPPAQPAPPPVRDIDRVSATCYDICKNRGLDMDKKLVEMFPGVPKSNLTLKEWDKFYHSLL